MAGVIKKENPRNQKALQISCVALNKSSSYLEEQFPYPLNKELGQLVILQILDKLKIIRFFLNANHSKILPGNMHLKRRFTAISSGNF